MTTHTTSRFPILAGLERPSDLAAMSDDQLGELAAEMREAIIDTVSQTGGHLGASLGTVELTIALHAELQSPRDRIIWDVGHQAYGHKLLTGRLDGFPTLRQHGGISGFLRRVESEHDVMGAGHASTSISYATGLAEAERHGRGDARVVAVIGDGALTGGMAYEGLNQAGHLGSPITVVLNDNGMSISENVGALSKLFQRVRIDPTLTRVREELERGLSRLPGASELGGHIRDATKSLWFVPGALFEALGFAYIGPIDGHDIEAVRRALRTTLEMDRPVVLHVKTVKGRGYPPAEADGECMHGATPFVIESGKAATKKAPGPPNYTEVFGRALVAEAERDPRVVGITAAMLKGTGMQHMLQAFPERTYDVGIAEQHAVVFACGLAIAGYRPVCAIYSTFLQRAFDPIIHDVAIQELPVVFAIDRGGLVGDDGPTHHGVFDLAYLRAIPGMTVMAPMDESELVSMLHTALRIDGPVAFRYPRGAGLGVPLPERPEVIEVGKGQVLESGEGVALIGYGYGAALAAAAADAVAEGTGARPTVVNARFCKPLDATLMRQLAERHELLVTIEDHSHLAGFGSAVLEALEDVPSRVLRLGLPDRFIDHGKREILLDEAGLTPAHVAARTLRALRGPSRMLVAEG
ncbi:1-deoxy-D-xylulose-5-phosphate synthase [Miltoncostaea marina]|uniref:1-deoxy-D-xylulose-5-phosphate synthase n=1 Tax=Miltoncostaea marina TaxID=2843215 RepID=UPI001C3C7585|nr:1-deoxy-D-xylulose-5-phosphate synthase [Miltoncostaea marina]